MAQHNFSRTFPANRQQIADPPADHEPARAALMAQETVWIEERAWKDAVPIFADHELEAVQMSGQHEIVTKLVRSLPDSRIVSAQDADVGGVRTDGMRAITLSE